MFRSHTTVNVTVHSLELGSGTDHCAESISITKEDAGSRSNHLLFKFCFDAIMAQHQTVDSLNGHWNLTYTKSSLHPGGRFLMTIKGISRLLQYSHKLHKILSYQLGNVPIEIYFLDSKKLKLNFYNFYSWRRNVRSELEMQQQWLISASLSFCDRTSSVHFGIYFCSSSSI